MEDAPAQPAAQTALRRPLADAGQRDAAPYCVGLPEISAISTPVPGRAGSLDALATGRCHAMRRSWRVLWRARERVTGGKAAGLRCCGGPGSLSCCAVAPVMAEEGVIFAGRQQEQQRRPGSRLGHSARKLSLLRRVTALSHQLGREASDSPSDNEDSGDESFRAAKWASSDSRSCAVSVRPGGSRQLAMRGI